MKKLFKILWRSIVVLIALLNLVVIFHAYKLTHFYEAAAAPLTAKTTWNNISDIILGIDYYKQQNSLPDTVLETHYLRTSDGLTLEAWYIPATAAKGSIAMFHGHGGKKSSLLPEAAVFRKWGYNTLLVDFRAHGSSQGNTSTIGQKESEDVLVAYEDLKNRGEKNIILYGVSMGAAAVMKAIHDGHVKPAKIIAEMPFASLTDAVEGRLKIMNLPPQPLATMLTFWGGTLHGFWAFNLQPQFYAKDIRCPVLLQWGRQDPRVSERETLQIYNNIAGSKKLVVYEQSAHESLFKKEPLKWLAEVQLFLR